MAVAAKEAAKRQAVKVNDKETKLQAAKAKEEAARQAREAEAARRAEQSPATKLNVTEAKEAAKAQEDAKLKAYEAEAAAIANATQEINARALTQQGDAQPNPSKNSKEPHFGLRHPRFPRKGLSKENAEYAHGQGWSDMGLGEGPSDTDNSTEKNHQEKGRRTTAEQTERYRQGLAMTGKAHWLVDAKTSAKLLGEVELSNII